MRLLAAFLVAASLSGTGCDLISGINDELEAGERELERYGGPASGKQPPEPAAEAAATPGQQPASDAVRRAAERWWGNAKSLIPSEKDPSVVRCEIGNKTHFMREPDCQMRGGRVSRG
jgi:hypothetical protein